MNTLQTKAARKAPAPYLIRHEHWIDDVQLICWMDYEAGDDSVGMGASAWLVHAYVGDSGMDVAELLLDSVVARIEAAAAAEIEEESEGR